MAGHAALPLAVAKKSQKNKVGSFVCRMDSKTYVFSKNEFKALCYI